MNTGIIAERRNQGVRHGFTLTELLVVIATVAVVAATLMPAFARTRFRAQEVRCLNNLKQMMVGWQSYADNHSGRFVGNGAWALGDVSYPSQATNSSLITNGQLYPYTKSLALYKCPGNRMNAVRGISMNGYVGNSLVVWGQGYKTYIKEASLTKPSEIFVFIDEDETTINDGAFRIDGQPLSPEIRFNERPAYYHNGGCGIAFADGRAEIHTWKRFGPDYYVGNWLVGVILSGPALEDGQYLLRASTTPLSGSW